MVFRYGDFGNRLRTVRLVDGHRQADREKLRNRRTWRKFQPVKNRIIQANTARVLCGSNRFPRTENRMHRRDDVRFLVGRKTWKSQLLQLKPRSHCFGSTNNRKFSSDSVSLREYRVQRKNAFNFDKLGKCIYVSIARKMHSWAVLQKTYQQPRKSMTLADLLLGMRSKWLSPTLWQVEPTNESLEVEKGNHSCQPRWWAWIPDINVPIFACSQTRNNEIR